MGSSRPEARRGRALLILAGDGFCAELVVDEQAGSDGEGDESRGGDGEDFVLMEDPGKREGEENEAEADEDADDASGADAMGDAEPGFGAGYRVRAGVGRQGKTLGEIGHALFAAELVGVVLEELLDEHDGDHEGKGQNDDGEGRMCPFHGGFLSKFATLDRGVAGKFHARE